MRIMFLGRGLDAIDMLKWTAVQPGVVIVGVAGDQPLNTYAAECAYPVISFEKMDQILEQDHEWADVLISFQYWRIIRPPIIRALRCGCINFHPAPLPAYKGRAGCSFAILDKLQEWGCTAHYMDDGIDTGNIIEVARFPFDWREETGISLKRKTLAAQCALYKRTISTFLQKGKLESVPQDPSKGRYISTKDMLDAMRIKDGDDIDAKIQAFWFPPYEGAYVELPDGRRYMLMNEVVLRQISEGLS